MIVVVVVAEVEAMGQSSANAAVQCPARPQGHSRMLQVSAHAASSCFDMCDPSVNHGMIWNVILSSQFLALSSLDKATVFEI